MNFTTAFGQLFQTAPIAMIAGVFGAIVAILSAIKLGLDTTKSYVELKKALVESARLKAESQGAPAILITDAGGSLGLIKAPRNRWAVWGLAMGLAVAIGTTWILATQSAQRLFEAEKLDMQLEHLAAELRLRGELAHSEATNCPCPPSPMPKP